MDIQENGEKTKSMEKELTFMLMEKNTKELGFETRKMVLASTNIKMVIYTLAVG